MLDRYTERARRVLFFARHELSTLGGEAIEPAHILLGLLREETILTLFANWNIPAADLRTRIEQQAPRGARLPAWVEVPFSDATRGLLNRTAEEADRLLHDRVGPEHLLLALLREQDPVAAHTLLASGITLDAAREYIVTHAAPESHAPPPRHAAARDLLVSLQIDRVMQLARDLAHAEANSAEGLALVERIEDELMILKLQFE